jgi:hypothetical protein
MVNTILGSIPVTDFGVSCAEPMGSVNGGSVKAILSVHRNSYLLAYCVS